MIAWLLAVAWADPTTDRLRQRELVEAAAAAVAEARASGARRSEVAERMAAYREAAAELERLEAAAAPSLEEDRRTRMAAIAELARALAEGEARTPARDVVAAWLGDPGARLALLEEALPGTLAAPADIRRGVLLDVIEQADALVAWAAFDAAVELARADQLEVRALGLRRAGPGQTAPITAEVEAQRLEAEALVAEGRAEGLQVLASRAGAVRARAAQALEEVP